MATIVDHRTNKVIIENENMGLLELVEFAVKNKISLENANLRNAKNTIKRIGG